MVCGKVENLDMSRRVRKRLRKSGRGKDLGGLFPLLCSCLLTGKERDKETLRQSVEIRTIAPQTFGSVSIWNASFEILPDVFSFIGKEISTCSLATSSQSIRVVIGLSLMTPVSRLMALVFWFGFPRRPWAKNSNAVSLSEGGRNIKDEQVGESNMGKNRLLV